MKSMKKTIALAVAIAMICGCAIGGTLAWLIDQTTEVQNTFTVGNIDIELTETWNTDSDKNGENDAWQGKMVPGNTLVKDPKVTVQAGSEACWVFVKVEEENNLDKYISYTIADGWTMLDANKNGKADDNIYWREQAVTNENVSYSVLAGDKVTVNNTVLKSDMDSLTEATQPKLVFTAYAVQKDNVASAADAWAIALNGGNPVTASGETV